MTFRERACPLCGSSEARTILDPEAAAFCRTNWSYAADAGAILGLDAAARFPIVECARCGLVRALLLPSDEFLSTLYDRVIQREACVAGSENRDSYARRCRYVADLVELAAPGARALDFGSGLGVTQRILQACGVECIGYDPSALRQDYGRGYELEVLSDREALAGRGPFGILVLDNVLEHVPDPVATVTFLRSLAAPGAVVYVSVPPYEPAMLERQIAAYRAGQPLDMTLNPWEHLSYFSRRTLDATMARGGFTPIPPPGPPGLGIRRETAAVARMKNSLASLPRLLRWGLRGRELESAEQRYYRLA
jgi:hypothetical protein